MIGKKKCTILSAAALLCALLSMAVPDAARAGQCNDGVDNDGDGKVDALVQMELGSAPFSGGRWVQTWNLTCAAACAQRGLLSAPNYFGDYCTSGEDNRQEAAEQLGIGIFLAGCWNKPCNQRLTNGTPSPTYSVNGSCYMPGQKQDWDSTDVTAACYCASRNPACSNGVDDDSDGLADFPQDPGCASAKDVSEQPHDSACTTPNDPGEADQCRNGADDDGDGLVDMADPGCSSPDDSNEGDGTSQCQDGRDNDGDGRIDYPADPGCTAPSDGDEMNAATVCTDGIDNDCDGYIDNDDDGCPESGGASECHSSLTQCDNCSDDDGDGRIDAADPDCSVPWGASEGTAGPKPQCSDGVDNDGDGKIDYPADPDCGSAADTTEQPESGTACSNGSDDDRDGYSDYQDDGCAASGGTSECHSSLTQCDNCIDDDGDGKIDMADSGCSAPWGASEGGGCGNNCGSTVCTDGQDNDGDGYVDSSDDGCAASGGTSECHSSLTQCDNCIDDDGDSLVDIKDAGCLVPWDVSESASQSLAKAAEVYGDRGSDNSDLVENMQASAADLLGSAITTQRAAKRAAALAGQAAAAAETARPRAQNAAECGVLKQAVRRYAAKMRQLKKLAAAGADRQSSGAMQKALRRGLGFSKTVVKENGCA